MATLATLAADVEGILSNIEAGMNAAGLSVPARVYVAPGNSVAWDEPQLTLSIVEVGMGQPGASASQSLLPSQLNQSVTLMLLWLTPCPSLSGDGALPATPALDAAGQAAATALADLWAVLVALRVAGKLPGGGAPFGNAGFVLGPARPVGPDGALVGVSVQMAMSLL